MSTTPTTSPLGTFHAVSCKDATSLDYDGQEFIEINELSSRTGEAAYEVGFADGMWLLAKSADLKLN